MLANPCFRSPDRGTFLRRRRLAHWEFCVTGTRGSNFYQYARTTTGQPHLRVLPCELWIVWVRLMRFPALPASEPSRALCCRIRRVAFKLRLNHGRPFSCIWLS